MGTSGIAPKIAPECISERAAELRGPKSFPVTDKSPMGSARGGTVKEEEDHSMRKKLLISTAALSAQDMPGGKSGGQSGATAQGGAQMERGSAGAGHTTKARNNVEECIWR